MTIFLGAGVLFSSYQMSEEDWGFFAHRKLNRLAVFTLPPQMMPLFKNEIEYLSAHAVDPDKRRYATPFEGPRHFIDIDVYGNFPYSDLPREWNLALAKYSSISIIDRCSGVGDIDTSLLYFPYIPFAEEEKDGQKSFGDFEDLEKMGYQKFFDQNILRGFYRKPWITNLEDWPELDSIHHCKESGCCKIWVEDQLSNYGIIPYYLPQLQSRLSNAMRSKNKSDILRHAADIGHYIGDAHVPLHTTVNYNGQLTGQEGIHAFWESRIPELFAEDFDLIVGRAQYIEDKESFFWDIVMDTHQKVDSVLDIERELRETYPEDAQMCFDDRMFRTTHQPCREFALAYEERMNDMVQRQMRKTIFAIGSAWYTAWVDAGQPDFGEELVSGEAHLIDSDSLIRVYKRGSIYGREQVND